MLVPYRWWLVLPGAILMLAVLSGPASAADGSSPLNLEPAATVLAILDGEDILASPENQLILEAAGFRVSILESCKTDDEQGCLRDSLLAVRERFPARDILLLTSARYGQAVYDLYKAAETKALVAGIVLFRAEEDFVAEPMDIALPGPPLVVIARETDEPDIVAASRRFADRVRQSGVWSWFVMVPPLTNVRLRQPFTVKIIYRFIGALPADDPFHTLLVEQSRWQDPPLDNLGFYAHPDFIETYPVDDGFREDMRSFFNRDRVQFNQWAFETYEGFDLLAYREANPATAGMRYLILRNQRGQFAAIDLDVYAAYEPTIVVGIDHEENLFRMSTLYRSNTRYTWVQDDTPISVSVDPLGAFLYFRKPLPDELYVILAARSKLRLDGIAFAKDDPLMTLDALPPAVREVVGGNCIFCHALDGVGGAAHHLVAATAEPQGGFALPLRSYPADVLRRFIFDQDTVAATFGVKPNWVPADSRQPLFEFLTGQE